MNEDIDFGGAAEARISRLESESVDVADSLHDLTMLWQGIHDHRRVVDHKLGTMDGMLVQANKAIVDLGVGQEARLPKPRSAGARNAPDWQASPASPTKPR